MTIRGLPIILVAEDYHADRVLLREAFREVTTAVDLRFVNNGQEVLDYVLRRPPWTNADGPDLILLDLKMPYLGGLDVLRDLKRSPKLKAIPIIVFTNSRAEEDIEEAYDRGASTYIPKPHSLDELTTSVRTLWEFWFKISVLPRVAEQQFGEPSTVATASGLGAFQRNPYGQPCSTAE